MNNGNARMFHDTTSKFEFPVVPVSGNIAKYCFFFQKSGEINQFSLILRNTAQLPVVLKGSILMV